MSSGENFKGILQELCQKRSNPIPAYSECKAIPEGGANIFTTTCQCTFNGNMFTAVGKGKTKKDAEKNSAYSILQQIYANFPNEKVDLGSPQSKPPPIQQHHQSFPSTPISSTPLFQDQSGLTINGVSLSGGDASTQQQQQQQQQQQYNNININGKRDYSELMQLRSEVAQMKAQYDQSLKFVNGRLEQADRRINDLKEYIDKKLKTKKTRKSERPTTTQVVPIKEIEEIPREKNTLSDKRLSGVTLHEIDSDTPEKIIFYQYRMVYSHGFKSKTYYHLDREYLFEGFMLFSPTILTKPIIHIANAAGDHFAVTIIEHKTITVLKEDFQKMVTFHHLFYCKILNQPEMEYITPTELYFLPDVKCLADPQRSYYQVLLDILTFEDISTELPDSLKGVSAKEFRKYFIDKYQNKVILGPRGDFNVCREVDKKNFVYSNNSGYNVTDLQGNSLQLKSDVCPRILVTHTCAANGKEFWALKPLLYFDKNGMGEDTKSWTFDQPNNQDGSKTKFLDFENFIRKSKLYAKDPLICKVFGVTSEMHAIAKTTVLVFIPEIRWCLKMEEFKRQYASIQKPLLLREVFTHPSSKKVHTSTPAEYKLFRGFYPFVTDNQRLEFLGDSVLKFCSTMYLYFKLPHAMEGELTSKRSELTNNTYLHAKCDEWGMENLLRFSATDTIKKPKADVMESLIGAIYLEKGTLDAYDFIVNKMYKDVKHANFPSYQCDHLYEKEPTPAQRDFLFSIHVPIKKTCLLNEATSCSEKTGPSYERLEFLGDSFLDMVVSTYLYQNYPDWQEGNLSQARALLVRNDTLSVLSTKIGLNKAISDNSVVFTTKKLGDLFESLVGCMLLDLGMQSTKEFIINNVVISNEHVDEVMESHFASQRPVPNNSTQPLPITSSDQIDITKIFSENIHVKSPLQTSQQQDQPLQSNNGEDEILSDPEPHEDEIPVDDEELIESNPNTPAKPSVGVQTKQIVENVDQPININNNNNNSNSNQSNSTEKSIIVSEGKVQAPSEVQEMDMENDINVNLLNK